MKAKIFVGPARSGKTQLAQLIASYIPLNRQLTIDAREIDADTALQVISNLIDTTTELIILDDVPEHFDYMQFAEWIPNGGTFTVNQKYQPYKLITLPFLNFIFTTNYKLGDIDGSFKRRFDLIHFP